MIVNEVVKKGMQIESKAKRGAVVAGQGLAGGAGLAGFITFLRSMGWAFWPESNDVWVVATFAPFFAGALHWASKFLPSNYSVGKGLRVLAVGGLAVGLTGCGHDGPNASEFLVDLLQGQIGDLFIQFIRGLAGV